MTCLFKISPINFIQIVAAGTQAGNRVAFCTDPVDQGVSNILVASYYIAVSFPSDTQYAGSIFQQMGQMIITGSYANFSQILIVFPCLFCQFLDCTAGGELSAYKQSYPVTDLLNLIKLVGGDQDRSALSFG